MAKTPSPRKPRTTRLRPASAKAPAGSGEAGPKPASAPKSSKLPKLPKSIQAVIDAAQDKKATGMVVLDLKKAGAFTDYFVICSGANPRQVQAIADAVEEALKGQKQRPSLVEGYARAEWVLLDYFDFVVHVFSKHARDFYALDRLWGSAVRHELPDQT
jgi:ribosome-associated protein